MDRIPRSRMHDSYSTVPNQPLHHPAKATIVNATCCPWPRSLLAGNKRHREPAPGLPAPTPKEPFKMSTITGMVLVIVLIATLPFWKHIKPYGYMPVIWASAMLRAHFYSIMSNPRLCLFV